jgi:hypothetical protein
VCASLFGCFNDRWKYVSMDFFAPHCGCIVFFIILWVSWLKASSSSLVSCLYALELR